jgi:hypothetical protein
VKREGFQIRLGTAPHVSRREAMTVSGRDVKLDTGHWPLLRQARCVGSQRFSFRVGRGRSIQAA